MFRLIGTALRTALPRRPPTALRRGRQFASLTHSLDSANGVHSPPDQPLQQSSTSVTTEDTAVDKTTPRAAARPKTATSTAQLLSALKVLRSQDRHQEVLGLWLREGNMGTLNNKILAHVVASAAKLGDNAVVLDTVEFATQNGIQPEQGTLLSYMKACAADVTDGSGPGCQRALDMLDRMRGNTSLNAPIFEEVATICFHAGKWRRALDVMNQMLSRNMGMSEKLQNAALQACAAIIDRSALTPAYQLFRNALRENRSLRPSVYAALISGFSEAGMHDEANAVWAHLEEAGLPITDSIFAARISQLGHTGQADRAEEVLNMSMDLKSQNRQSINTMTNVLLKAGRVEDACNYLKSMKALKKLKISPQLVEYHVKALAQGGHIHAAISFLEHWRMFPKPVLGRIWQDLFRDCLYLGQFHGGELVYRHATNAANSRTGVDTSGWLSRLFAEVGEAGQARYLLHLCKSLPIAGDPMAVYDVIRSMCLCRLFVEAVDLHQAVVVDAARPALGASHLLVIMLCRRDLWREARMVIKDIHRLCGNRAGCLPSLFTRAVQIAARTVKGQGNTLEMWQLQQQLACRPSWNCARYSIKALFAECQWEKCLDIYQSRHVCTGYHGTRLDQKTMTRVIRAYGHLERWMDAMEVFADYVEEAALARPAPTEASPGEGKATSIHMVIQVVMEVLSQYGQEQLVPNVLNRLVEKGIPISEATLKEAFLRTTTDNVTSTLHVHRRLLHVAMQSGYPKESLGSLYTRAIRGKHTWISKLQDSGSEL